MEKAIDLGDPNFDPVELITRFQKWLKKVYKRDDIFRVSQLMYYVNVEISENCTSTDVVDVMVIWIETKLIKRSGLKDTWNTKYYEISCLERTNDLIP